MQNISKLMDMLTIGVFVCGTLGYRGFIKCDTCLDNGAVGEVCTGEEKKGGGGGGGAGAGRRHVPRTKHEKKRTQARGRGGGGGGGVGGTEQKKEKGKAAPSHSGAQAFRFEKASARETPLDD